MQGKSKRYCWSWKRKSIPTDGWAQDTDCIRSVLSFYFFLRSSGANQSILTGSTAFVLPEGLTIQQWNASCFVKLKRFFTVIGFTDSTVDNPYMNQDWSLQCLTDNQKAGYSERTLLFLCGVSLGAFVLRAPDRCPLAPEEVHELPLKDLPIIPMRSRFCRCRLVKHRNIQPVHFQIHFTLPPTIVRAASATTQGHSYHAFNFVILKLLLKTIINPASGVIRSRTSFLPRTDP